MYLPGRPPDLALGHIDPFFVKDFTIIIIRFGVNIEIFYPQFMTASHGISSRKS